MMQARLLGAKSAKRSATTATAWHRSSSKTNGWDVGFTPAPKKNGENKWNVTSWPKKKLKII
jgi:hypothetical protein